MCESARGAELEVSGGLALASGGARNGACRAPAQGVADRRGLDGRAAPTRPDDRREPEAPGLGEAPVGMGDRPQLAGQADLAEARHEPGPLAVLRRTGDGERDREVRARLVDADAPD